VALRIAGTSAKYVTFVGHNLKVPPFYPYKNLYEYNVHCKYVLVHTDRNWKVLAGKISKYTHCIIQIDSLYFNILRLIISVAFILLQIYSNLLIRVADILRFEFVMAVKVTDDQKILNMREEAYSTFLGYDATYSCM
jgi:hypothetical protein